MMSRNHFMMLWIGMALDVVTLIKRSHCCLVRYVVQENMRARGYICVPKTRIARINAFLQETISGAQTVQIFTAEQKSKSTFHDINDDHRRNANIDKSFDYSLFVPLVDLIGAFGSGVW